MDRELLKAIIQEVFAAALVFVDGKRFLTLAVKMVQSILLRDAVLDKILAALFGNGINLTTFATSLKASGVALPAHNVVASNEASTADELETKFAAACAQP